jgi:chromosomal replication initiation ATPase DnaA
MMSLIAYPPVYDAKRVIPLRKAFVAAKRKRIPSKAERTQAVLEEFNREGLRVFRQRGLPESLRDIVKQVAAERGVTIMLIASHSMMRSAVWARNEAMYRIKELRPGLPMSSFAKWFDRDHTSAQHGIANHAALNGLPKLVGYDIENVRRRNVGIAARVRADNKRKLS